MPSAQAHSYPNNFAAPIRLIDGPRRSDLELRGALLIANLHAFVATTTLYSPIEWITVEHYRRFNAHYIFKALLTIIISLVLLPIVHVFSVYIVPSTAPIEPYLLTVIAVISGCVFLFSLGQFCLRRPVTRLIIWSANPVRLEFWHTPNARPELDQIVEILESADALVRNAELYPVALRHEWVKPNPWRMQLVKALFFSFVLRFPVEYLYNHGYPELVWFMALPWVYYFGRYAFTRLLRLQDPKLHRLAARAYDRGDAKTAENLLRPLVREHPEYEGSHALLIYACMHQEKFEQALDECARLSRQNVVLADGITERVWLIRRLFDRMYVPIKKIGRDSMAGEVFALAATPSGGVEQSS